MVFFQVLFSVLAIALIVWIVATIVIAIAMRATSGRTPVQVRTPEPPRTG